MNRLACVLLLMMLPARGGAQGASLAFGIGPYNHFDTSYGVGSGLDYRNDQGGGTIARL